VYSLRVLWTFNVSTIANVITFFTKIYKISNK
jgi:hypothetical protein